MNPYRTAVGSPEFSDFILCFQGFKLFIMASPLEISKLLSMAACAYNPSTQSRKIQLEATRPCFK
jgi:hypothetical protein